MAIQKVQHATDFEITKHRVHVELDAASNFVIIVDEPPNRAAQTIDTIDKDITVLEIATGLSVAEIQGTPSGFTPFVPDHPNLDKSDIFIWSGEVFIVEYNSTNKYIRLIQVRMIRNKRSKPGWCSLNFCHR